MNVIDSVYYAKDVSLLVQLNHVHCFNRQVYVDN
jgi:hypothetical protein